MLKYLYPSLLLLSVSSLTLAQTLPLEPIISDTSTARLQPSIMQTTPQVITPFTARYSVLHKSKKVGTAVRKLKKLTNNNYLYSYETDIEWLIFDDKRVEESTIKLENNQVIPTHYKYLREGTGRDKFYEWTYDIPNNTGTNLKENKQVAIEFPRNTQDSLSYHLQHRLNLIQHPEQKTFTYSVVKSSGAVREYEYEYDGVEEIMLPYGLVKTIKLKREVIDKERVTYAWFAPELNYLLVRLYQAKGGTEQFEAQLTSIETH